MKNTKWRKKNPTFTFIETAVKPAFNDMGLLVTAGLGVFRCNQNNTIHYKTFVPAGCIPPGYRQVAQRFPK